MIETAVHTVTGDEPTVLVEFEPTVPASGTVTDLVAGIRSQCRVVVRNDNAEGGDPVYLLGDGQDATEDGFTLAAGERVEIVLPGAGVLSAVCAEGDTATVSVIVSRV